MNMTTLWAVLAGLASAALAVFLYTSLTPTWKDYHADLKMEFKNGILETGAPEDIAEEVAHCMADAAVDSFTAAECKLPSDKISPNSAAEMCLMMNSTAMYLFMTSSVACTQQPRPPMGAQPTLPPGPMIMPAPEGM